MSDSARRWVFRGPRELEIEQFRFRSESVRPRQLALRTIQTAISPGTELANYLGLDPDSFRPDGWCRYPWVPGYSGVAEVIACGAQVSEFKSGDRVLGLLRHSSHQFLDLDDPRWPVMMVGDSVADADAALVRLLGIAANIAHVCGGSPATTAVWGQGLVGNFTAQLLQLAGHTVIAIDPDRRRRALSGESGVRFVRDGGAADELASLIRELTNGGALDVAVDSVGNAALTVQIPNFVRRGGVLVLATHWRSQPPVDASALVNAIFQNDIHVRSGFESASTTWSQWAGAIRSSWTELLKSVASGQLRLGAAKACAIRAEQTDIYDLLADAGNPTRPLTALVSW